MQFPQLYFITNKITSVQNLSDALKMQNFYDLCHRGAAEEALGSFYVHLPVFSSCVGTYKLPTSRSRCSIWAGENNCNGCKPADVTWQRLFKGTTVLDLTARPFNPSKSEGFGALHWWWLHFGIKKQSKCSFVMLWQAEKHGVFYFKGAKH